MILLEVPFAEKETAKSLGARWNPAEKKWYVISKSKSIKYLRHFHVVYHYDLTQPNKFLELLYIYEL